MFRPSGDGVVCRFLQSYRPACRRVSFDQWAVLNRQDWSLSAAQEHCWLGRPFTHRTCCGCWMFTAYFRGDLICWFCAHCFLWWFQCGMIEIECRTGSFVKAVVCFSVLSLRVITYQHTLMACLLIWLNPNYSKRHSLIDWYSMNAIDCFFISLYCVLFSCNFVLLFILYIILVWYHAFDVIVLYIIINKYFSGYPLVLARPWIFNVAKSRP